MLHIKCSTWDKAIKDPRFIRSPDVTFELKCKDEWLESDFGRKIITELERIPLIYPSVKMSIHAVCALSEISTGGKNLFLCKYLDGLNFMDRMGDNCFDYLMDIADEKDVYMVSTAYRMYRVQSMTGRVVHFDDFGLDVQTPIEWMSAMHEGAIANGWFGRDVEDDDD